MAMTRTTTNLSAEDARAARRWYIANADGKVLGRRLATKLKIYAGPDHPHQAQKPVPLPESR